ncbi:hypothetical protein BASA83_006866 [Batrachochytrium salamandrivorans]|nr:hypothetical protein BASA62_009232 [Batrachochytrium salamandrivorans]KAH9270913.1 hypothetical protein BASA83_006866 [Batrachochytrium salamandrivorans]
MLRRTLGVIGMRAHLCVRSPTANAWHLLGCYRNAPLGSKSPTSITIRIADISTVPTPNTPAKEQTDHDTHGTYTPKKDPMAEMTEDQKNQIRKEIREQGYRVYSIGYAIIGGSMALVLACVWFFK